MGICFYLYELKMKIFQNFIYNIYEKLWGDEIINSLIWIFIRTGQEVFSEENKIEISKCHIFLISHPIFIIFSLFCRKQCTLSFNIDSILEWISPLNNYMGSTLPLNNKCLRFETIFIWKNEYIIIIIIWLCICAIHNLGTIALTCYNLTQTLQRKKICF